MAESTSKIRVVFMGSADFSCPTLNLLLQEYPPIALYCAPPRPAGRGQKIRLCPTQQLAEEKNFQGIINNRQDLHATQAIEEFKQLKPDIAIVVAYGALLPEAFLQIPKFGAINLHPSILPRWRGAAPIQHAILAGDKFSGISIMQMDKGLDSGPIITQSQIDISGKNSPELHAYFAKLGADKILSLLHDLQNGKTNKSTKQADKGISYARKLTKEDGRIIWQDLSAERNYS